jgi:hypothetical protein
LAAIPRALAKMRGALQTLPAGVSVIVLGSKHHILRRIFDDARAPFHKWGQTVELGPIPTEEYTDYANARLRTTGHQLTAGASSTLQAELGHIPETMNRFCHYLSQRAPLGLIGETHIARYIDGIVEDSRSVFESEFSHYTKNERSILCEIAKQGIVKSVAGKAFLANVPDVSKSGVLQIVERLLDRSVLAVSRVADNPMYSLGDPLMASYIRKFHGLI